jgi:hypothetical protein
MEDGGWKMEDGRWQMAGCRWRVEDGRWKMADGRWRIERPQSPKGGKSKTRVLVKLRQASGQPSLNPS